MIASHQCPAVVSIVQVGEVGDGVRGTRLIHAGVLLKVDLNGLLAGIGGAEMQIKALKSACQLPD